MSLALALVLLFGVFLVGTPIVLGFTAHALGGVASTLMLGSGILLVTFCAVLLTITKLYVKTRASEAFVRTGMGGLKVIRDGGALVLPVVHQFVRVSLETIRLVVERKGADAMITNDKLRADIRAEFFVRVQPDTESIQAAARSLGDKMDEILNTRANTEGDSVSRLIEDKLVSALRTAAARKTLEGLNTERDEFLKEVVALVKDDLAHNGFTLETVTISKLDQTDEQHLKENNIFDAQGKRTIAEITQKNLTERNQIIRRGEQERAGQDVEARKRILDLDRTRAEAEANQASQVAILQAEQERTAKQKQIEASQSIQIAEVEQSKQVEVAKRAQLREIEIAERQKLKAITEADQNLQVAKRAQEKAIAEAEAQRAIAEAKLADAEAERQKARQTVLTVEQIAAAEREKDKAIIAARAEAEKSYVAAEKAADASAYRTKTEAEARKASADAEAEATRKKAQAEAEAQRARAEGDKAIKLAEAEGTRARLLAEAEGQRAVAMVPIEVRAREVEVDKQRVEEVLKPELEARQKSGSVAQEFELSKIRIEREAEVRIESAKATAQIYGKITANVYGTPADVARMGEAFAKGMGISQSIEGFLAGSTTETQEVAKKLIETTSNAVGAVIEKISADGLSSS